MPPANRADEAGSSQVLADQRDNTRHRSDDELKDLIAKTASLVLADALTSGGDFRLAVTKWTRVAARESATEAAETVAKREAVLTAQKIAHNLWRIERQRLREQEPACRRCRDLEIKMKNMINTKIHAMNVQMEALLTRAKIAAVDAATSRVKEEGPFAMSINAMIRKGNAPIREENKVLNARIEALEAKLNALAAMVDSIN